MWTRQTCLLLTFLIVISRGTTYGLIDIAAAARPTESAFHLAVPEASSSTALDLRTGEGALAVCGPAYAEVVAYAGEAGLIPPKQERRGRPPDPLSAAEAAALYRQASSGQVDSARLLLAFAVAPAMAVSASGASPYHRAALQGEVSAVDELAQRYGTVDVVRAAEGGHTPLHLAVAAGQLATVRALLAAGADTEAPGPGEATALQVASSLGRAAVVRALLRAGAVLDAKHPFAGATALHFAAEMGHVAAVRALCRRGASHARKLNGAQPLHTAADANQWRAVEALVRECGADVEALVQGDTTALYLAAQRGHEETVRALLALGADPDFAMPSGRLHAHVARPGHLSLTSEPGNGATALHAAVENGHPAVVALLVGPGGGADVNTAAMQGVAPLHLAVMYRQLAVLELLLRLRPAPPLRLDQRTGLEGATALFLAAGTAHAADAARMCEMLLAAGASPKVRNREGALAAEHAAHVGNERALEALLEAYPAAASGGEIEAAGGEAAAGAGGMTTALHAAARAGRSSACRRLARAAVEAGPGVDVAGPDGQTPLHLAAHRGAMGCVRALLAAGASPRARVTSTGCTPLHMAALQGHAAAVRALLQGPAPREHQAGVHEAEDRASAQRDREGEDGRQEEARRGGREGLEAGGQAEERLGGGGERRGGAGWVDGGCMPEHGGDVTALFMAAQQGRAGAVRALLERGAQGDRMAEGLGTSPLLVAAERGHSAVVRALLAGGADPNQRTRQLAVGPRGATALHLAARATSADAVRALLGHGAQARPAEGGAAERRAAEGGAAVPGHSLHRLPIWDALLTGDVEVTCVLLAGAEYSRTEEAALLAAAQEARSFDLLQALATACGRRREPEAGEL